RPHSLRLRSAARPRLRAVRQVHGPKGHPANRWRATCPAAPPSDAGLLVAAHRAAPIEDRRHHRRNARRDRARRPSIRRHARLRRKARRRRAAHRYARSERVAKTHFAGLPSGSAATDRGEAGPSLAPGVLGCISALFGSREGGHRRAAPRSDFVSDLVLAHDNGDKLDDEELFDLIFAMFAALATTPRSGSGALYMLYSHRDQLQQLLSD